MMNDKLIKIKFAQPAKERPKRNANLKSLAESPCKVAKSESQFKVEASEEEHEEDSCAANLPAEPPGAVERRAKPVSSTTTSSAADCDLYVLAKEKQLKEYPWLSNQSTESVKERLRTLKNFGFAQLKEFPFLTSHSKRILCCRLLAFVERIESSAPEGFCQALLDKDFAVRDFHSAFPNPKKRCVSATSTTTSGVKANDPMRNAMGQFLASGNDASPETPRKCTKGELREEQLREELQCWSVQDLLKRVKDGGRSSFELHMVTEKRELVDLIVCQEMGAGRVSSATSTASAI